MFVLVILGVAAVVTKSVPVEPSEKATEDVRHAPKLQLAFLVEDADYKLNQFQKLQQKIARSGRKAVQGSRRTLEEENEIEDGRKRRSLPSEDPFRSQLEAGYSRKRRSAQSTQVQVTDAEIHDDQLKVESDPRVSAASIANILKVAGAKATPINRVGGYGRKRRSPQDSSSNNEDQEAVETATDQIAVETHSRVSAASIANILKAAGAKATPINRVGGYGRKRRSAMDNSGTEFDSLDDDNDILQSISPDRMKRSPQQEPFPHANAHQYGLVDDQELVTKSDGAGKYGDLQRILALTGAKPQPISKGVSYGRRKKRTPEEAISNEIKTGPNLVKDVSIEAVKVKSHGNYGNIAQVYDTGANSKHVVINGRYGRRKRADNFIPFNVYDERRVKTLKIEQNDALALPMRLQIEKENGERNVKKRHFAQTT